MISRLYHIVLLVVLAIPILLTSCFGASVPGLPVINSFNSTPSAVADGSPAVLDWNVSNASNVVIDHGIGSVSVSGSRAVSPNITTDYMLTASNAVGSVTSVVRLVVAPVGSLPPNPTGNRNWLASTYTLEYHWPSCSIAQNIPPPSQIWFDTVNQAQAAGYHPCPVCHPPR